MSLNFNTQAFGNLEAKLKANLEKAAIYLTGKAKEKCNRGQPYEKVGSRYYGLSPSLPGEAPKRVTGDFVKSITYNPTLNGQFNIGSNLKRASWLEYGTSKMAPRPWLRPTLIENREAVTRIILGTTT